jgi:hypothetical protein
MILELADRDEAERILIAHQRRDIRGCLCGWGELGRSHPAHQVEVLAAAGLFREQAPAAVVEDDAVDSDESALPAVAPRFMWLIYLECPVCGAAERQPCVGMTYSAHEGRKRHWEDKRWRPTAGAGRTVAELSLDEWVGQALGSASMCWSNPAGAGEFDSSRCGWVLDGLMGHLNKVVDGVIAGTAKAMAETDQPLLGLATTREMLVELEVRAGVGRLDPNWRDFARALLRMEQITSGLQAALPEPVLEYRTVDS